MPLFINLLLRAGNLLAPIVAQMGLILMTERVVRRVSVITLNALADSTKNKFTHELLSEVSKALDVPQEVYKK